MLSLIFYIGVHFFCKAIIIFILDPERRRELELRLAVVGFIFQHACKLVKIVTVITYLGHGLVKERLKIFQPLISKIPEVPYPAEMTEYFLVCSSERNGITRHIAPLEEGKLIFQD